LRGSGRKQQHQQQPASLTETDIFPDRQEERMRGMQNDMREEDLLLLFFSSTDRSIFLFLFACLLFFYPSTSTIDASCCYASSGENVFLGSREKKKKAND
jgi:hypothetical protein